MTTGRQPRLLVAGGSLGGLIAGGLFHRAGWDVQVFERAVGHLEGRGAGITVLPGLVEGLQGAGVEVTEQDLGVELPERIALDLSGRVVARRAFRQVMTSWKFLYDILRAAFPPQRYHEGHTVTRVEQDAQQVRVHFADGGSAEGDLLIGADGLRSAVRTQFLPQVHPHYPGYIAWRSLADEAALDAATRGVLGDCYAVCVTPGQQGICYPVPGPDHRRGPGERQFNVVWYHPVPETALRWMQTDVTGQHHPFGIPPSLVAPAVREHMLALAPNVLAPAFAEVVLRSRIHFFQPIVDWELPRLAFGRVALIGDAAFVARPHVAMGVPKAAGDALALLRHAQAAGDELPAALARFETERLRIDGAMVGRGRYLGSYMAAQAGSAQERARAEAGRDPEQVMLETAAPFAYG